MTTPFPEGYTTRPPTLDDAPAVAAVMAACQAADGDKPDMSAEELRHDWAGTNLEDEALVVLAPDGQIVANADLLNRGGVQFAVYGYVHPDARGRGIGRALVRWGEAWAHRHEEKAPAGVRLVVHQFVRTTNQSARQLLESLGYGIIRTHYWMDIEMEGPPPAPVWPAGISVRPYVPGEDDAAVFTAGEESFRDMWNRPPSTQERWLAPTTADDFDPSLWFLAFDAQTGEPAAVCLSQNVAGHGYIASLGVRRAWRRQGLGLALLRHAFGEFYKRGVRDVGLSVDADSPTGAPQLYRQAGMHETKSYVRYELEIRPGEDPLSSNV